MVGKLSLLLTMLFACAGIASATANDPCPAATFPESSQSHAASAARTPHHLQASAGPRLQRPIAQQAELFVIPVRVQA